MHKSVFPSLMNELFRVIIFRLSFQNFPAKQVLTNCYDINSWMILLGIEPSLVYFIEPNPIGTRLFLTMVDLSKMRAEKASYNRFPRR